ncbi:MAG: ribosomal protein S18-alanine N-acetyltransferase [Burkholderiaceae bacterium]
MSNKAKPASSAFDSASLLQFVPMQVEDIDAVLAIENTVYPHPWTRGNFKDALHSGYQAWVAREQLGGAAGDVVGYFLLMLVLDEGHLLNISVRADVQGRGFGRALMDRVVSMARELELASVLLEVRPSNTRALNMYAQYGFMSIGRRKAYYPAAENTREDAFVMRLSL